MNKIWLLILFLLILLLIRFGFYYHNRSNYTNGQQLSVQTTLFTEPQIVGNFQKFSVRDTGGELIFITIPRFPAYHYADSMRIVGKIQKRVINSKKIIWTMQFPKVEAVKKEKNTPIESGLAATSFIRQKVISIFEETLPQTSSSLLLGIIFGIKQNIPSDFNNALRTSGVLHVIAASGMNVTLVGGFLSSFFVLFFKRQIALIASIIGIIFYAFLAGSEPSILRASIMGIAVFSSQILGRQSLAVYTLALAGFIMLFISPLLLHDIGFQLSFLATLGILYIKSGLDRVLEQKYLLSKLIEIDVTTTISAQVATLPILFATFGQYSIISILVNGLVLWTIPTIMILGGIGAIAGLILEPIGKLFLYLSLPLLLYFEKVVVFFANFGGQITLEEFPLSLVVGYYCLLASAIAFLSKKRS